MSTTQTKKSKSIAWLQSLGPGLITAALVFGPSKVTIASIMGADYGFSLLWLVVVAIFFMIIFTTMAARVGIATNKSLLSTIADKWGTPARIAIGVGVFLVTASFQAGNSIGAGITLAEATHTPKVIWIIVCNLLGITILLLKGFYKVLEKIMITLIIMMLFAFIVTMLMSQPPVGKIVEGFVPSVPDKSMGLIIAFTASCFSIVGAIYQSYLVQERRRIRPDLKLTGKEALPGMLILGFMSATVMICAAMVLHPAGIKITTATDMAKALEPVFGNAAAALFLVGLFGASFSSLLGNAALGGTLLGDALGYGGQLSSKMVRVFIAIIMLIGATVAITFGKLPLELIVLAQAVTIFIVPFIGIALFFVANDEKIMGPLKNSRFTNIAAILGLLLMIGLGIHSAIKLLS
ncbi:divalent metal cation transporter [Chitinophaga silvatica]|uniref:Divalent metal cation transporter n=1 Tax=Chitinophaga silvatica TaxID=2282649 RepID=A0A3E1Y5P9_9BACT|nr:Nramp family divalent metal transporter [Chitinophaga silvatica]RFS20051.1 divalent metal cation transporter [Chitinophaga silvatica]